MLKQLYIKNFKSLLDNRLLLKPLTLLTGLNSSGKSSALQALRMLERYYRYGDPVISDLGRLWDLKSNLSKKNGFSIECIDSSDKTYSVLTDFKNSNSVKISSKPALSSKVQFPSLCYISADRWGPRPFLPLNSSVEELRNVGNQGEYVIDYLERHEDESIAELLKHPDSEGNTLKFNVKAWLGEITPGIDFQFKTDKKRGISYSEIDGFRPTNAGFGLSYTLPAIVALLGSTCPDSFIKTVIVENPEAHLHPKGQVKIAELIALVANSGTQVIVESHSDHILNGIRLAVYNQKISHQDVCIHYFENKDPHEQKTSIISPKIDKNGRIDKWPDGFFDVWDKCLEELLTPRK